VYKYLDRVNGMVGRCSGLSTALDGWARRQENSLRQENP